LLVILFLFLWSRVSVWTISRLYPSFLCIYFIVCLLVVVACFSFEVVPICSCCMLWVYIKVDLLSSGLGLYLSGGFSVMLTKIQCTTLECNCFIKLLRWLDFIAHLLSLSMFYEGVAHKLNFFVDPFVHVVFLYSWDPMCHMSFSAYFYSSFFYFLHSSQHFYLFSVYMFFYCMITILICYILDYRRWS